MWLLFFFFPFSPILNLSKLIVAAAIHYILKLLTSKLFMLDPGISELSVKPEIFTYLLTPRPVHQEYIGKL